MARKMGNTMTSQEIRRGFLSFFAEKGHTIVPSSSLVPYEDPSLLFTNAGMVQFKHVFTGSESRPYNKAVSSQKCMRAGGKHNDLESVGFTGRHQTFFEMLGNFSFGDYGKREAIAFAWEFVTDFLGLPAERIWTTVYKDDQEARDLWREIAGLSDERIVGLGERDNFWSMGDTGPCGPSSEVMVDRGEEHACGPDCAIGQCDCDRWLEIWNLVFMQYDQDEGGKRTPLPRPCIDTGMGLERVASILQGTDTNFDTDLFLPLLSAIHHIAGTDPASPHKVFPYRVIADHARSLVFLAADGVRPSNEGRGYVMRKILRRASRFGRTLGIQEPFLGKLVGVVVSIMGGFYPEIAGSEEFTKALLTDEESRFLDALDDGEKRLLPIISAAKADGRPLISGEDAFMLHDTFGFPIELTEDIVREAGLGVDRESFHQHMEDQRNRSRKDRADGFGRDTSTDSFAASLPPTVFVGYATDEAEATVLGLAKDGLPIEVANEGIEVAVILDSTPFYATGGGQEADQGALYVGDTMVGRVLGAMDTPSGVRLHKVKVTSQLTLGARVRAVCDHERRRGLRRHHTATHLIHSALRQVLGGHVAQAGSLVQPDRLRFDFSHPHAMTREELHAVEDLVNEQVLLDLPVLVEELALDEARSRGAMALFGEKYGERVRTVSVPGWSMELCGGLHVSRTGEIGLVQILGEGAVASGVRRLQAVAGPEAAARSREASATIDALSEILGTDREGLLEKAKSLVATARDLARQLEREETDKLSELSKAVMEDSSAVTLAPGNLKVVVSRHDGMDVKGLRELGDRLRAKGASVVILGSGAGGKATIIAMADDVAVRAGADAASIVKEAANEIEGSGGGRANMAQAGGKRIPGLDEALRVAGHRALLMLEG